MEVFGSFLDEEWESLSKMFSSEDSEFLLHFNWEDLFPNQGEIPTNFLHDQSLSFPSDTFDQTNLCCVSQESSNSSDIEGAPFANPIDENGVSFPHPNTFESMDSYTTNDGLTMLPVFHQECVGIQTAESDDFCQERTFKRNNVTPEIQTQDQDHSSDQSPKKKCRVSGDNGLINKRKTQSKKNKKAIIQNEEEEKNTCSSEEDDSNGSESKDLASNGKTKANKGFATDPQSLYARRRRERINERLRTLQNLVPNGTKVDISTMLEEAVHYVKFLQLQIKLLSSDELWMYAPIAYNGMDIGLYRKILPNL